MSETVTPARLAAWIQTGLVALVALMPFHAFFSVWLGHIAGHQALWQSWKEVLIAVLAGLSLWLLAREPRRLRRLATPFNYAFLGFIAVALVVTVFSFDSVVTVVFGLKTDCEFLVALIIAQLVADSAFVTRLLRTILISSGVVIAIGLLQIFALPPDFLRHFGYGPDTIQPFLRLDPAVSDIRIVATLGGPNQLGSFLVLPLALVFWQVVHRPRWWHAGYMAGGMIVLWHTYSRGAGIALAAAFLVIILLYLPRRWRWGGMLVAVSLAAVALNLVLANLGGNGSLQYYLFHQTTHETGVPASTDQHLDALEQGIAKIGKQPLGHGLGSAGPASFQGDHPFIPESYYLQLGVEAGLLGAGLFIAGCGLLGWRLWKLGDGKGSAVWRRQAASGAVATLAGISLLNLILHGWADSSTALVFWSFAGAVVASKA